MGNCASIQYSKNKPTLLITNNDEPSTNKVKVINSINGNLQEYQQPIKASQILSDNNLNNMFFLCSSEHMFVNCYMPRVQEDEELQLGHIYFLMPISKLYKILTLQELCLLAIKASVALDKKCSSSSQMKKGGGGGRTTSFKGKTGGARKQHKVDFQLALKQLG